MSTTEYQDPYGPVGAWHEWIEGLPPDRAAYYRSEKWRSKRRERRRRDGHRCVVCGHHYKQHLVCHHITYKNFGNEPLEDLRTVCADCHRTASDAELRRERPIEEYLKEKRARELHAEEEAEYWEEYRLRKEWEHATGGHWYPGSWDEYWDRIDNGDNPPVPAGFRA